MILTVVESLVIPVAAIAIPALLGFYYFIAQRRRERMTITDALTEEMERLKEVLRSHLTWIGKPTSANLPLVPFDTAVYDAQLAGIVDGGANLFLNSYKKAIREAVNL